MHIWVNPFRVTSSGNISTSDMVYKNCSPWLLKYDNGSFSGVIIDPGFPQARAYVIKVLMEIVNCYDVDGILMDDYFYPYGGTTTEDAASLAKYKPAGMDDGDWRRSNVDTFLKDLYDSIQTVKPWVRFGMGPFGIWTTQKAVATKYGISLPSGITGLDDYAVQNCNTVEWVKGGYVDYIAPQLYWSTVYAGQDYDVLDRWWAQDVCRHFSNLLPGKQRVDFFPSQAAYHVYDGYKGYEDGMEEMYRQMEDNRTIAGVSGSIFYNTTAYLKMATDLRAHYFTRKALPPAMDWKPTTALAAPTQLAVVGNTLTWNHPTAQRFTVYAYPKNMSVDLALASSDYLLGVTYANNCDISAVSDRNNTSIAVCAYDRFGNEYAPAIYNQGQPPVYECNPDGWKSKDEMFAAWGQDYNAYYHVAIPWLSLQEYRDADESANQIAMETYVYNKYMYEFMANSSKWAWLKNYVENYTLARAAAGDVTPGGTLVTALGTDEVKWRWAMSAFWVESQEFKSPYSADFTTAGLYDAFASAWGYKFCNSTTDLDPLTAHPITGNPSPVTVTKLLRNGQLIIIRNGVQYNMLGQCVQ